MVKAAWCQGLAIGVGYRNVNGFRHAFRAIAVLSPAERGRASSNRYRHLRGLAPLNGDVRRTDRAMPTLRCSGRLKPQSKSGAAHCMPDSRQPGGVCDDEFDCRSGLGNRLLAVDDVFHHAKIGQVADQADKALRNDVTSKCADT